MSEFIVNSVMLLCAASAVVASCSLAVVVMDMLRQSKLSKAPNGEKPIYRIAPDPIVRWVIRLNDGRIGAIDFRVEAAAIEYLEEHYDNLGRIVKLVETKEG